MTRFSSSSAAVLALFLLATPQLPAQLAGQQGQTGQGGQTGQTGQTGQGGQANGILIDADGVVTPTFSGDKKLDAKRKAELAGKRLPADLNTFSPLRKVSLVELEKLCESYVARKENVPPEVAYLAGLQRIDYVFVDPAGKDLIIAGPAEGFTVNGLGRATGLTKGRPAMRLDDLMVALRTAEMGEILGCSIDPDQSRLRELQNYIARNNNPVGEDVAKDRFRRMQEILGIQDIRIFGVPAESHFASMLVEADYRMKLIALQLEPAPVKGFRSHLSMVGGGGNAMQRFWFVPLYDKFRKSEDGLAFQFRGQRVQLLSQEEMTSASGARSDAPFTKISTERFAKQFTDRYAEVADANPIYAELQSGIDLAVLAALFKKERLPNMVGWSMSLFLDNERAEFIKYNVPRKVHSAMNYKSASGKLVMVVGGITINPRQVLAKVQFESDDGVAKKAREEAIKGDAPPAHLWWWD